MTDDVRAHILATATAVFAEKGFGKAGINDIVKASGLSKGGVYWHFASKDEIVTAIFNQFFEGQLGAVAALIEQPNLSATEKLLSLSQQAGADVEMLAAQFPSSLEFYALAARDDGLREQLLHYFGLYENAVRQLVDQGINGGEWRATDAQNTARTIIALFEGLLLLYGVLPKGFDLQQQAMNAMTLLLEGLKHHT